MQFVMLKFVLCYGVFYNSFQIKLKLIQVKGINKLFGKKRPLRTQKYIISCVYSHFHNQ